MKRLVNIDMMIGMAMLFVVLGHMSVGNEPQWYSHGLHNWIYSFHMRMFVFLSAFLICYTYKGVHSVKDYCLYIWRKFIKFFLPFLLISAVVILIRSNFTPNISQFTTLITCPRCTEASFLWYIYLLFGFYIISPLFLRLPQFLKVVCCIASMFLPMLSAGNRFCAFDYTQYTFFYCLGVLCAEWIEDINKVKTWPWIVLSLPFVAFSIWVFTQGIAIGFEFPQLGWWLLPVGVASLPFFRLLATLLAKNPLLCKMFTLISRNCYWIYILQMFVIWGCRYIVHDSLPYGLFMTVSALLALAIPIALAELAHYLTNKKSRATLEPPR